jgi:hypothetical protein
MLPRLVHQQRSDLEFLEHWSEAGRMVGVGVRGDSHIHALGLVVLLDMIDKRLTTILKAAVDHHDSLLGRIREKVTESERDCVAAPLPISYGVKVDFKAHWRCPGTAVCTPLPGCVLRGRNEQTTYCLLAGLLGPVPLDALGPRLQGT